MHILLLKFQGILLAVLSSASENFEEECNQTFVKINILTRDMLQHPNVLTVFILSMAAQPFPYPPLTDKKLISLSGVKEEKSVPLPQAWTASDMF